MPKSKFMKIDILTLFPDMFKGPFDESMLKKAQEKGLVKINIHNLRKWGIDKRGTVDDRPYGGGTGMLLRPEPIFDAVKDLKKVGPYSLKEIGPAKKGSEASGPFTRALVEGRSDLKESAKVILLSPAGKPYSQKKARQFAKKAHLILICGHYEGVDYRVNKYLVDEVVSIGDYVLTGGEMPAMVVVDSVVRLIPGVLEKEATESESFSLTSFTSSGMDKITHVRFFVQREKKGKAKTVSLLEYPQYTRPEVFKGRKVPKILLSGNHQEIETWRQRKALSRTRRLRPDLLTP